MTTRKINMLFTVRDSARDILAAFAHADHAAAFVAIVGDGATVESPHGILWRQGEKFDGDAGESYDLAADRMRERAERFASDAARSALVRVRLSAVPR